MRCLGFYRHKDTFTGFGDVAFKDSVLFTNQFDEIPIGITHRDQP